LRRRVMKSAIGSVIDMCSPAGLRHAGDVAVVSQLSQADPAYPELAVDGARTAAATAPGVPPGLVLGRSLLANAL
jgi:hypothetical protein